MPGLTHLYIGEEAVAVGVCSALRTRRLDHLDPSRSRALPREGRRRRPDVRGAARQGGRLLPRQGRLDAHRRPRERQPRRERDRRRLRRNRNRRRVLREAARHEPGRGVLLRRGRARPGARLRGDEHGVALVAPGGLRLREQPVQRVHALSRGDGGRASSRDRARSGSRRARSTARTCARSTRGRRARRARPRRVVARAFLARNTYRYHGHHVGDVDRAYYRSKAEEDLWRSERDPLALFGAWLRARTASRPQDDLQRIEDGARAEIEAGLEFALDAPFPDSSQVTRMSMPSVEAPAGMRDADVRAGDQRGARRGAAPRRDRVRHRRGRRRGRHAVQGARRASSRSSGPSRVVDSPISEAGDHRPRRRRRDDRACARSSTSCSATSSRSSWTSSRTRRRRRTTCRAASSRCR